MKAGRSAFLHLLVQELDRTGISWCCLRNHLEFFEDSRSDVDLMILPEDQTLFERTLDQVARQSGADLLQKASYLNQSRTYLTPAGEWVRVDYETEVRWGIFPVLTAREVLHRRIREKNIWLASPADESVILWIASLFRGQISDRYRVRLAELVPGVERQPIHRRIFHRTFGGLGWSLLSWQRLLADHNFKGLTWIDFKLALWTQPLFAAGKFILLVKYLFRDIGRLWTRLQSPPGIVIQIDSETWTKADSLEYLWRLDPVFPIAKSLQWNRLAPTKYFSTLGIHFKLFRTLFKGGVILVFSSKEKLFLPAHFPRRFFLRSVDKSHWVGASALSGRMVNSRNPNPIHACFDLLTALLALTPPAPANRKALFCVLLGLDGSGKTTLARSLATSAPAELGVFYYRHFLPKTRDDIEFPWPRQIAEPKKAQIHPGPVSALVSFFRLLRNTARAFLSRWGWRGTLGVKGAVVLVDRYLYNYLLDPASVAYAGSAALARLALRWAPRPDIIFVLEASASLLTQRKGELSSREIEEQSIRLHDMPLHARKVVRLDGSLSPEILARQCCQEIRDGIGWD